MILLIHNEICGSSICDTLSEDNRCNNCIRCALPNMSRAKIIEEYKYELREIYGRHGDDTIDT